MGRRNRARRPQRPKGVVHTYAEGGRSGAFRCAGCRLEVPVRAPGTAHRNHCPHCLASLHVDLRVPGDRAAHCGGPMRAVGMTARSDGEWQLVHRCVRCEALSTNRVAGDDNARALVRVAVRPLRDTGVARRALARL